MHNLQDTSRTPYEAFRAAVAARPDAVFLRLPRAARLDYAPEGLEIGYADMSSRVEAQREEYGRAGYGQGAVVALFLGNRPDFFVHFLALDALGVAILPINPDLRPEELAYQFSIAEPDLAVVLEERRDVVVAAGLAAERVAAPGEPVPACSRSVARQAGAPDDPCALLFTSGTTGKPKCCVLSNDYFMCLARWYITQGGVASMRAGEEVILTPLPLFHMNALACSALGAILLRGTLVPLDRFHASRWWQTVAEAQATVVHYLGVMPAILLKLDEDKIERAHCVRFGFGAGVDPRHQHSFESRFGLPLVEAWAMTETGGGAATSTAGGDRHVGERCVGYPAAGMAWRIVDDGGVDVASGEAGELLVRSKAADPRLGFFFCYLKDEAATVEAWRDGWFHTGDVVKEGSDGALFFVDRKKNIVRRSGENISVVEVEGVLQNLAEIAAVAVAPVPDDMRQEEVFALVKLKPGIASSAATAEAIVSSCSRYLAYHKLPAYVAFVETLPVTATQKLQRADLRRMAETALAKPETVDLRSLKGSLRKQAAS